MSEASCHPQAKGYQRLISGTLLWDTMKAEVSADAAEVSPDVGPGASVPQSVPQSVPSRIVDIADEKAASDTRDTKDASQPPSLGGAEKSMPSIVALFPRGGRGRKSRGS